MDPELILILIFIILIVIFPVIARISGWSTIANFYRFTGEFQGKRWYFQSAEMRWKMGYNSCLTIGTNESGLYLSIFFPFRFGHPNLFIPWGEVTFDKKKGFIRKFVEFRFKQAPMIPFCLSEKLGNLIIESSGYMEPKK